MIKLLASQQSRELTNSVQVFGLYDTEWRNQLDNWGSISANTYPVHPPQKLGYSSALGKALIDFQPDIIHLHGLWKLTTFQCSKISKRLGSKLIISPHGMLDPWALRASGLFKRMAKTVYELQAIDSSYCIHALNRSEATSIRKFGSKRPVCIIPNAVKSSHDTNKSSLNPIKKLIFLGRLDPKKNIVGTVRAFHQYLNRNPESEWQLDVYGWGDGKFVENLHKIVDSLERKDRIAIKGPVYGDAKTEVLMRADAFVLSSFSEGMPMAVLEAWAHGLPALISRECNLVEAFELRIATEASTTQSALSRDIERFLSLPEEEMLAMGTRAKKHVRAQYSIERVVQDFDDLYSWAMGAASQPRNVYA